MNKITFQYWIERLKESIAAIAIIAVFLGIILYAMLNNNSKVLRTEKVTGELVNFHQIQSDDGSNSSVFFVKLNDGSIVRVFPPAHTAIKINQKILLKKMEKESGKVDYQFIRYNNGG